MYATPQNSRYPSQAAYTLALLGGQILPVTESKNVLSHPTGPDYQLVVGEGTYILKEDLHLASPPPHSSEALVLTSNPLATTPQPATAGTKISLLCYNSTNPTLQIGISESNKSARSVTYVENTADKSNDSKGSADKTSTKSEDERTSASGSIKQAPSTSSVLVFGESNSFLPIVAKDVGKKKKPKNNIARSNSSFISRCSIHENLAKRLQETRSNGYFAFANISRAFQWLELSSNQRAEYLTKILFSKGHCLCHDINQATITPSHIDLIMGFSTGEIIWYEPISQKYTRLNKNGIINENSVSDIKWIPGSENLFLVAHTNGSLVTYDKEKDDAPFMPEESSILNNSQPENTESNLESLHVNKSVNSKNQKFNPVSYWKLLSQRINAFSFSPNNKLLAVVCEDGTLRIIDYLNVKLLHNFFSYYGGFTCVCWSPDSKYLLTGGQDDLVSIWSVSDSRIVARCQGHHSWVTAVCFDTWRCDGLNYRFGSVGEDCRLLLWDFSESMLHRPKAIGMRLRGSICSRYVGLYKQETNGSRFRSNSEVPIPEDMEHTVDHPAEPRATTAVLPPVMSKVIHDDPLCWIGFTKEAIMTSCRSGHLRIWSRPRDITRVSHET